MDVVLISVLIIATLLAVAFAVTLCVRRTERVTPDLTTIVQNTQHMNLPDLTKPPTSEAQTISVKRESARIAWLAVRSSPRPMPPGPFKLEEVVNIGRDWGGNEIRLDDETVSHFHARIRFENGRYWLYDLGAKNQTRVNELPIRKHLLVDGDYVQIGQTMFVFKEVRLTRSKAE